MSDNLGIVTWVHTATGQDVYVTCFWIQQFSDREALAEKHLLIAVRKTTWDDLANEKQAKIRTAINKLLAGEVRLTKEQMQIWRDALADANIKFALVDNPVAVLKAAGLRPKTEE